MVEYGVEPIYKLIGKRIRAAREQLNMSQADLASRIRVSTAAITHYENASRRIPIHHLRHIENVLKKPYEYFVNETAFSSNIPIREQFISFANSISNGIYLPIVEYARQNVGKADDEYDPYDLKNKPLAPFPQEVGKGAEFAFRICVNSKITYILINTAKTPDLEDFIFLPEILEDVATDNNIEWYEIAKYEDYVNERKKYEEHGIKYHEQKDILGVVTCIVDKYAPGEVNRFITTEFSGLRFLK